MSYPVLPAPPYYVAIFRCTRNGLDDGGYDEASERMFEMAHRQPGFLGVHTLRTENGEGVTLSYWTDEASIRAWRAQDEEQVVREADRRAWYARYSLQIARVERAYSWSEDEDASRARPQTMSFAD